MARLMRPTGNFRSASRPYSLISPARGADCIAAASKQRHFTMRLPNCAKTASFGRHRAELFTLDRDRAELFVASSPAAHGPTAQGIERSLGVAFFATWQARGSLSGHHSPARKGLPRLAELPAQRPEMPRPAIEPRRGFSQRGRCHAHASARCRDRTPMAAATPATAAKLLARTCMLLRASDKNAR